MPTPLCDALRAFANQQPLRMHMPGHKGRATPLQELSPAAALDVTELTPTGNLFSGGGPIGAAEELWAAQTGMEQCLFLTGGSTQGLFAAFALACRPGEEILLDRGSHRAAYHAAVLLDLTPVYLSRPWWGEAGISGPVEPQQVAQTMEEHPNAKTVCITSPTYYGVISDIPAIAQEVHRRGGRLIVDGAHGPHLFFLGDSSLSKADLLVLSAHKTLPAMGQSALLLSNGYDHAALRRAAALFGSSSPSYLMMASMDAAREDLNGEGGELYRAAARRTARLRERFPAVTGRGASLDPTRLVLLAGDGFAAAEKLEGLGVWPEMADRNHVVFILTSMDRELEFDWLEQALAVLSDCWGLKEETEDLTPPAPPAAMSLRSAWFSNRERVALRQAEGRISACQVAPYPPGVPVVAPGEWVTKKALAYLQKVGYNMEQEIEVVASGA